MSLDLNLVMVVFEKEMKKKGFSVTSVSGKIWNREGRTIPIWKQFSGGDGG